MTSFRQGENIMAFVARRFGISARRLSGPSRQKSVSRARGAAMALCRELTGMSYPEIGWLFNKHHTTVLYAVKHADQGLLSELKEDMGCVG